ncbi:tyrosine-type recombinase/integrase [uncultured Dysosmobacter sp.]|uniref:tyrosine-type recombinase/integrase n=1 Tax=uncultured Dysosmobacter sp. TaxID=2591384 RepID=UPI00261260A3|nr:tyrosine-type recombinase/integrase [uncultured Dysosmobacter sp.]
MARRSANGTGTIRKKTVTRGGKKYEYWEARYTEGADPGTGKQVQRSITGKTQKEVAQKLKAATAAIDSGTYTAPSKQTVGQWLDAWIETYCGSIKPRTLEIYKTDIRVHIKPALGAVRLEALTTQMIQSFYNDLGKPAKERPEGLSPKTVKNIHGVLHKALQQAVLIGSLRFNPTEACTLPRQEKRELAPLDDEQITAFLAAIQDSPLKTLLTVTLFTGMREGEILGLMWDCVDFNAGTITINKQLQRYRESGGGVYRLSVPKNSKGRTITPAASVMALLKQHRAIQAAQRLRAGRLWEDSGFAFTDELGHHLTNSIVYRAFKRAAAEIGRPDARFHDLRHSYAVASIRSGDDIKTVQENLGHATASFTLDVYGHVTKQMKQASAGRMEAYIKSVSSK